MFAFQRARGSLGRKCVGRVLAEKRVLSGYARISRERRNPNAQGRGEVMKNGQPTDCVKYQIYALSLGEKGKRARKRSAQSGARVLRYDGRRERIQIHHDGRQGYGQESRQDYRARIPAKVHGRI